MEERNFKEGELLGNYMAKILYKWNNKKFEEKYSKKLKKN